ncbi:MAG: DUF3536 domain-containing protein [Patescibacteria group bacterium]|nr:DUF3536 domain-containing protein [Patescibacteria group bacterium]
MSSDLKKYLAVVGHFYQPPRHHPFTGKIPREILNGQYRNYNELITAQCYRPLAEGGIFGLISFDLGPTLASWIEANAPDVDYQVKKSVYEHHGAYGCSPALAQPYNHSILPLLSNRDKRIQVAWGLSDYKHRFGLKAKGMWLPETAVDLTTLEIMSDFGIQFTVLAPWQAIGVIDHQEPAYRIDLPNGKHIVAFFFDEGLNRAVSCNESEYLTVNADTFSQEVLCRQFTEKTGLAIIASDGETYGHHHQFRDMFLHCLLTVSARNHGFEPITLARYYHEKFQIEPPGKTIRIIDGSSWSCWKGVKRWSIGGDSECGLIGCGDCHGPSYRLALQETFRPLADKIDKIFEEWTTGILKDPWKAAEKYIEVVSGGQSLENFLSNQGLSHRTELEKRITKLLLEAFYLRQEMFTSCVFFWGNQPRIETARGVVVAKAAIQKVREATLIDLTPTLEEGLSKCQINGRNLYDLSQECWRELSRAA